PCRLHVAADGGPGGSGHGAKPRPLSSPPPRSRGWRCGDLRGPAAARGSSGLHQAPARSSAPGAGEGGAGVQDERTGGRRLSGSPSLAMGHNGSWISRNASEPRNASSAEAAGANRSALGEFGEAQLYRQFTTSVQVVIFIGSLLEPGGAPCTMGGPSSG
uniref:Uncharacterized protein n=1 Tax=Ovis aries TaxID=9940 RepID=A0AC11CZP4_SHEEP